MQVEPYFRRFLLCKCINGEKATYNTNVFATKRERTYQVGYSHRYIKVALWWREIKLLKPFLFCLRKKVVLDTTGR